jgi:hypothetical protein
MSDTRLFNVHLTHALYDSLIDLAARNNRTLADEARHAFQRHLASPPAVNHLSRTQDVPALADVPYVAPRRTGRRAKKKGDTP